MAQIPRAQTAVNDAFVSSSVMCREYSVVGRDAVPDRTLTARDWAYAGRDDRHAQRAQERATWNVVSTESSIDAYSLGSLHTVVRIRGDRAEPQGGPVLVAPWAVPVETAGQRLTRRWGCNRVAQRTIHGCCWVRSESHGRNAPLLVSRARSSAAFRSSASFFRRAASRAGASRSSSATASAIARRASDSPA